VHPFRFFADLEALNQMARLRVDDAQLRRVFVGDIHLFAIRADVTCSGSGPTGSAFTSFRCRIVDDADAIGACGRAAAISIRRRWDRRSGIR
jgi:hypothetical protein